MQLVCCLAFDSSVFVFCARSLYVLLMLEDFLRNRARHHQKRQNLRAQSCGRFARTSTLDCLHRCCEQKRLFTAGAPKCVAAGAKDLICATISRDHLEEIVFGLPAPEFLLAFHT